VYKNKRSFLKQTAIRASLGLCLYFFPAQLPAQDFNLNSAIYNVCVGAFSGGIGAVINKPKEVKPFKAFIKGFLTGAGGGAVMYSGKKLNFLVSQKQNLGYAWISRAVYSAGNSVVENTAAGREPWSQWHYDLGFIRLEFQVAARKLQPKLMPSSLGGMLFMARNGRLDLLTTLRSGTFTYRTGRIGYSPTLVGSTASNGFLLSDTLIRGLNYYDVYAHEMIHAFQFQDFSGTNYFFKPITDSWETRSRQFRNFHKWVYGDLNYEVMLINYFIVNGGSRGANYCHNFLENEAEFLSTGRSACH
jgi:hypothetical protein